MKLPETCRLAIVTAALALGLAGCSQAPDQPASAADASERPIPVEPDGGMGDGAGPPAPESNVGATPLAKAMPTSMFGRWHMNDLGRPPTAADCDPFRDGTRDYDRLITVREGGYSYFETGGRITTVHSRTDTGIDATFDTTYADTPTSARKDFALRSDGTLAVSDADDVGRPSVTEYRRCPGEE